MARAARMPATTTTITGSSDWQFVNSNGPRVPSDPAVRRKIRQQAMKDVAIARRQRSDRDSTSRALKAALKEADNSRNQNCQAEAGDYLDLSPLSISISSTESDSDSSSGGVSLDVATKFQDTGSPDDFDIQQALFDWMTRPARTPLGSYEALRSRYGVDVTNLGMLTTFSVSKATIRILGKEPWRLISVLGLGRPSYLDYIPCRYGHSRTLTAAVDCVTAKVCSKLMPLDTSYEATALRLYSKALKELQRDIADGQKSQHPDVLCAAELLSLHELIDASRPTAWDHHIQGCGQLVRHRSPSKFKTDYEKSLFLGHVGPIVTKSLVTGEACYLDSPEWMSVWESVIDPAASSLTDRSELAIKLRIHISRMPGIFSQVTKAILGPELFDPIRLATLRLMCRSSIGDLTDWHEAYKAYCVQSSFRQVGESELVLRRELFGSAMECTLIMKRLLAAIDEDERLNLEIEVQALANLIHSLQESLPGSSWLFVGHEVNAAQLVDETKAEWEERLDSATTEEKLLSSRRRFLNFIELMLGLNLRAEQS